MSTIALIEKLESEGIHSCAVCDDRGTPEERGRLRTAVSGKALFTPLYWWNHKIRSALWKRPLIELKQLLQTGWRISSTRKLLQAIQEWHPDLIHTNTLLTPEGGLAARKVGLPHIWHVRELVGPGLPFRFGRNWPAFGGYVAQHSDHVIANSNITAELIGKWLRPGLVTVIPNGISCATFTSVARPANGNPKIVAMVANLASRVKKHHLFIRAAAAVKPDLPIEWRIYGHDPSNGGRLPTDSYIDSLHALARELKIDARLSFPGHLPPESIMREIDLLVHPTDQESFGRVIVEAMAAGVPVVGVNGGGVAEILNYEPDGLLARPDDAADLARCIERMLDDREFASRCIASGRKRAVSEYSIEVTSHRVASVYHEVLERFRKKPAPIR